MLALIMSVMFALDASAQTSNQKKFVVNAYVGGYRGLITTEAIDADKLTHINYAFVDVKDSMAVLTNLRTDSANFRRLNELKKINPNLKILISIGGWSWSENFSDAVLTPSSRRKFARSSVDIIKRYELDGVDVDWEYPGIPGEEGNIYRPEDKQNFTLMFKEIQKELDSLELLNGKKYELTAAVGGSKSFINNTQMDEVGEILDYVWIMTYDYGDALTSHHTNLYASRHNKDGSSADKSVRDFLAAGVPAHKIGLGAAFYGKASEAASGKRRGIRQPKVTSNTGQRVAAQGMGGGFTKLKNTVINKNGYKRHWDNKAKAPYLFNKETKVFITYDDERSLRKKMQYVKKYNLAGIFFWEYFNDSEEILLNVIDKELDAR